MGTKQDEVFDYGVKELSFPLIQFVQFSYSPAF